MSIASKTSNGMRLAGGAAVVAACLISTNALAGDDAPGPSQNTTINLIRLLVKQHVISQESANALLREAESEAREARGQTRQATAVPSVVPTPAPAPPPMGTVRVPYVPEIVKNQIRDEVRDEVIAQARTENWAQPNALPGWVKRFEFYGDFRFRDQSNLFSQTNGDALGIIDFANLNANGPININPNALPLDIPYLNVTQNRYNLLSLRLHLGVNVHVNDAVTVGVRLATGQDSSPVSTTQLLGGGLTKDDIWLDQAWLGIRLDPHVGLTMGRMPDPFVHTNLVYDDNLNFDGINAHIDAAPGGNAPLDLFGNFGFFPLGYVSDNFPADGPFGEKNSDRARYMAAAQLAANWTTPSFSWLNSAAYYDFVGMQGELSSPCDVTLTAQCSTDQTRPAFMQKGNTLILLRDIVPPAGSPTNYAEPQFVGLAMNYRLLDLTSTFTQKIGPKYDVQLQADFVRNMAYNPKAPFRYGALDYPLTNGILNSSGGTNLFVPDKLLSGPNGYQGIVTVGDLVIHDQWQWNVFAGYRYLQPDAVIDGFTYADFHLGGTNAKGYILGGTLAFYKDTTATVRWLSADQIFGPRLAIDVLQLDLNTYF